MVIITFTEIINLAIATIAIGYIFSGMFKKPRTEFDTYVKPMGFDWDDFKFSILVVAPGVILHELAHKFVAMYYGLSATFFLFKTGLLIGIVLKLVNSGFLLLAPGFVGIAGAASNFQSMMIAFAGPFSNLVLFLVSEIILRKKIVKKREQIIAVYLSKQVNLWLFIFNMLPIPPLDGFHVFSSLFKLLF